MATRGKPITIADIGRSYSSAIKKMSDPYRNVAKYEPAMKNQITPTGTMKPPPGSPSVSFNVKTRGFWS